MKSWLQICGVVGILLLSATLRSQIICLPSGNCSCENEKVSANLTISNPVKLTGSLIDPSRAPIQFSGTIIQVGNPKNDEVLFSAELDQHGRFDFGIVPAGKYRLIAFRMEGKKARRCPIGVDGDAVFTEILGGYRDRRGAHPHITPCHGEKRAHARRRPGCRDSGQRGQPGTTNGCRGEESPQRYAEHPGIPAGGVRRHS